MLFSKILVPFDGSNLSRKALSKAVDIVKETASRESGKPVLEVLHIVQDVSYAMGTTITVDPKISQAVIDEAKQMVPSDVQASFAIEYGQPANTILNYANDNGFDFIIMGSRGLGTIREFFLGSVSHNVVQNSKVPVLIVK
ncbi:Stress response protein NhaX [Paenibacillus konkukensis]|uniref:Stress response protein NhaX n=1 Tax=Paenibacillus konkukensis TaxID=2020716 RepID=A0ABY4RRL1_9BACL|nr:universal stress protein [Paenibacillus konkukensis]UQZ85092.1 Stress response protein NhaX [Paenibacillus konkukensis]